MNARRSDRSICAGMTLIEGVVSIVIVSVMLVAAMTAMGSFARARRSQFARCAGAALARAMMGEILRARYLEPGQDVSFGRESSEADDCRAAWDDVDDYNGLAETPPRTKDGQPIAGTDGWTRRVVIEYVQPTNPQQTAADDTGLVRITVSAESPDGVRTTLQSLRGDQGIYDQSPRAETTFVTGIGAQMQIGASEPRRVTTGTHVLNRVPVP